MRKYTLRLVFSMLALAMSLSLATNVWANESKEGGFNPGEMIFHHIGDNHEWHFATLGEKHFSIPLPVIIYAPGKGVTTFMSSKFHHSPEIETADSTLHLASGAVNGYALDSHNHLVALDGHKFYDLSITKNVASLFISVILLFGVFLPVAGAYSKNRGKAPKGIQNFFEPIILFIRDDIARPSIGKKADKFMPYLLTVFFFIWFNNLLGLLPGGANLTGNISVTLVLAIITFLITNFNGNKDYWMHVVNMPGVPMFLKVIPIMPLVEFIGLFTKPFSLMVRLFANITAGHIIILSLLSLIFIFESFAVGIFSTVFSTAMYFLELFVAILQAYVFTLLSALYFGGAVAEHHHDDAHH